MTRCVKCEPIRMPGIEPIRIDVTTLKFGVPNAIVASPAAIVTSIAWNRSVPTTRRALSGNRVTRVIPKNTPEPTEVRPRMKPKTTPITTASVLWARVSSPSVGRLSAFQMPGIVMNVRAATGSFRHRLRIPVDARALSSKAVSLLSCASRATVATGRPAAATLRASSSQLSRWQEMATTPRPSACAATIVSSEPGSNCTVRARSRRSMARSSSADRPRLANEARPTRARQCGSRSGKAMARCSSAARRCRGARNHASHPAAAPSATPARWGRRERSGRSRRSARTRNSRRTRLANGAARRAGGAPV